MNVTFVPEQIDVPEPDTMDTEAVPEDPEVTLITFDVLVQGALTVAGKEIDQLLIVPTS